MQLRRVRARQPIEQRSRKHEGHPRIIERQRDLLSMLSGLLTEASRVYRRMKAG
jgi:hypothetical protein